MYELEDQGGTRSTFGYLLNIYLEYFLNDCYFWDIYIFKDAIFPLVAIRPTFFIYCDWDGLDKKPKPLFLNRDQRPTSPNSLKLLDPLPLSHSPQSSLWVIAATMEYYGRDQIAKFSTQGTIIAN